MNFLRLVALGFLALLVTLLTVESCQAAEFHGRPFSATEVPKPPTPKPLEEETVLVAFYDQAMSRDAPSIDEYMGLALCLASEADVIISCVKRNAPVGTTEPEIIAILGKPIGRVDAKACPAGGNPGKACIDGFATVHVLYNIVFVVAYIDNKVEAITYRIMTKDEQDLGGPAEWGF